MLSHGLYEPYIKAFVAFILPVDMSFSSSISIKERLILLLCSNKVEYDCRVTTVMTVIFKVFLYC